MFVPTPFNEDTNDFTSTQIQCKDCGHQQSIVGPAPRKASCSRCGSRKVAVKSETKPGGRRAA